MKTILLILMLVAGNGFRAQADGGNDGIPETALQSFQRMFNQASDVAWSQAEAYYRADFRFNGQYVQAYYDCGGTLIAMKKNILSTQLPLLLEVSLRRDFGQFWITNMQEVSSEGGVLYVATLENGNSRIQLKSTVNEWSVLNNSRK